MAISLFNQERNYALNHYRAKPLKDGFLLTNDFGFWIYLDKHEYEMLRHNKVENNQPLFSLLKSKGFILTDNDTDNLISDFRQRIKYLFRGTYYHVVHLENISLSKGEIEKNIKKTADFILQSPPSQIIVEFKGKADEKFEFIRIFVDELKKGNSRKIKFRIETDLKNINNEIINLLVNNKFDVWFPVKNMIFNGEAYDNLKNLQRRIGINFYVDVTNEVLGKEQALVDYFVDNNFRSFFVRNNGNITNEQFIDFWRKILEYSAAINKKHKRVVFYEGLASMLLKKILSLEDVPYPELNSVCTGAIVSELAYTLDGSIYANSEGVGTELFNIGNVSSRYPSVVGDGESISLISSSINSDTYLETSVFKPYVGNCPVCNYRENGNIIPKYPSERTSLLVSMYEYLFEKLIFEAGYLDSIYDSR